MSDIGALAIAVCIKICPDTAQLRADPRTGAPRLDQAPRRIGTFDENALEEAVRLKQRCGGTVVALSLAEAEPPPELILRALAMGADEARVVVDPTAGQADALATARILCAALEKSGPVDIVLCGEGSLDAYHRQVGPRLAEALGMPLLGHLTRVEVRDGALVAHRALEDRTLIVQTSPPVVLTVGQEINQPRLPTVLQIMAASRKPNVTWRLVDLGFDERETAAGLSGVTTLEISAPPDERQRIAVEGDSAAALAGNLANVLFERGLVRG